MPKKEKHFDRMLMAAGTSRTLSNHYDTLSEDDRREMVMETCWLVGELMAVRNMVAAAVSLEATTEELIRSEAEQLGMTDEEPA